MTNELQSVLDEIKLEKDSKLLPENIKKGVKIFDITGTLEQGGASTDAPVKLFDSVDDMNADTDAKEDDLALVYGEDISNWDGSSPVKQFVLPKKVVLPSAITSDLWLYGYSHGTVYVDIQGEITSSSANISIYGDESCDARYTSTDGITYERTDTGPETIVVSESAVTIRMYEWDSNIGYFMRSGGMHFGGLFKYTLNTQLDEVQFPNLATATIDAPLNIDDSTSSFVFNEKLPTKYCASKLRSLDGIYYEDVNGKLKRLIGGAWFNRILVNSSNKPIGFASVSNIDNIEPYAKVYDVNPDTMELTNETDVQVSSFSTDNYAYAMITDMKSGPMATTSSWDELDIGLIMNTSTKWTWSNDVNCYNYADAYIYAPTQLTLSKANELLPGKIGYGKNGIVEGDSSVYANIDWSTDIISNVPTDVFLEYHSLPVKFSSSTIHSDHKAEKANMFYSITDSNTSNAVVISLNTTAVNNYAKTIGDTSLSRATSNVCAIYDNKLIWGCIIGSSTATQSLYIIYYDYVTKTFSHLLVADNLTNVYTNAYPINFCTDEKDGSLCICGTVSVDSYTYASYNSFVYKWCADGTFKQLFYNSFNDFDTDITASTSSSTLYSCGVIVYDDTVYLGYYRYSTNCYTRLVKVKNGVRTNIVAYQSTGLDYMPRFVSWFGKQRMWIEGNIAYFINRTNSTEYLSALDLSTGTLTNLHTLSYNYYKQNRAYNTECFYKYNDNLYLCISYATTSSSSSSSDDYAVQIYKYNITNNTISNLGYSNYSTGCRGDEPGRLLPLLKGNILCFECANSTIKINVSDDTFIVDNTSTVPSISWHYPYEYNGITYQWSVSPCIMLENKTFTKTKTGSSVFVSVLEDLSKYALFDLNMGDVYSGTMSPTEYTEALDTVDEILGEEV